MWYINEYIIVNKDLRVKKRVVVGLSGGVDSSVAALLLKQQGYDVIGLFMKNWEEVDEQGVCTSQQDFDDVKRISQIIDIPYYTINLSKEYYNNVFKLFVEEYKKGRTPNPDVLCNREIKFGHFKDFAMKLGADYIATGHYCGTLKDKDNLTYLTRAKDENKCQTYFLNQVTMQQIENVLFPLSDLYKKEVREIAAQNNLITAEKKDSTGICFIGERNFRAFLANYIPMRQGEIKTLDGKTVGTHKGVFYYTIGQRKGFGIGGKEGLDNTKPWFIIKKDVINNILYVNQGQPEQLFSSQLTTEKFNFITKPLPQKHNRISFRLRHRQPLQNGQATLLDDGKIQLIFDQKQRAVTEGQYCAIYDRNICVGGGVIDSYK